MVIFFSTTGNSEYCAEMIADKLNDVTEDAIYYIKRNITPEFESDKPWIFVAPVYAWQLPHVFSDFLKKASFKGSKEAYFVITCGGDISAAGVKAKNLTEELQLNFRGALEVKMPDNYVLIYDIASEEHCAKRMKFADKTLEKGIDIIKADKNFPENKIGVVEKIKSGPINTAFYKFMISSKPFYVKKDTCISCGLCEKMCPLNNIKLTDGYPIWGAVCTHCVACIHNCPTESIQYGKATEKRRRYHAPEYIVE